MPSIKRLLLVVLICATPFVAAFGSVDFLHVVTFGDSMTHNDILWIFSGAPRAMYGNDPAEAVFLKGARPGDKLTNFAVAGTPSSKVEWEIAAYETQVRQGRIPPATLVNFQIGGQDLLDNIDLLMNNPPGTNPQADAVIDQLIANFLHAVNRIKSAGLGLKIVVWTIGDLSLTPRYFGKLTPQQVSNLEGHTERANRAIRELSIPDRLLVFDLYNIQQYFTVNPPVIAGFQIVGPPQFGLYWALFADSIHLTEVTNAILADVIIISMNDQWSSAIPEYTESELAQMARILVPVGN
jgi:hypothetical protein